MNIALIIPHTHSITGNLVTARRLAQGLRARGHEVFINGAEEELPKAVDIDVVHSFNAVKTVAALSSLRNSKELPWVVTLTGTDYTVNSCELGPILNEVDRIIVFHKDAMETVSELCPQEVRKVSVIPQGVTVQAEKDSFPIRQKLSAKEETIVFFVAAGLRPIKNISITLKAFKELEKRISNLALWLAGPVLHKNEADKIFTLSKELQSFNYLGALDHNELLEIYGAVDIFINTSRAEGMPAAILEAMAARVAVIATDVPGNRNVVTQELTGLLIADDDVDALARAMENLATDKSGRLRLGAAAKKYVEDMHDPNEEIDNLEAIYQELI